MLKPVESLGDEEQFLFEAITALGVKQEMHDQFVELLYIAGAFHDGIVPDSIPDAVNIVRKVNDWCDKNTGAMITSSQVALKCLADIAQVQYDRLRGNNQSKRQNMGDGK